VRAGHVACESAHYNGQPFASCALGRRSQLSVWWLRLGIRPELIEPASPHQNGRHERMHRDLKAETTRPAASSLGAQQRRFDTFRRTFNEVRPHEALAQRRPAAFYTPSDRLYLPRLRPMTYPEHFEVRRVSTNGGIRWLKRWHLGWQDERDYRTPQLIRWRTAAQGVWVVGARRVAVNHLDHRSASRTTFGADELFVSHISSSPDLLGRTPDDVRISRGPSCRRPDKSHASLAALQEGTARAAPRAPPARRLHARVRRPVDWSSKCRDGASRIRPPGSRSRGTCRRQPLALLQP
jgi:hypothetical protein